MDIQYYENQANCQFTKEQFALFMDNNDPLKEFRSKFHYPIMKTFPKVDLNLVNPEEDVIYLCGNSLGLSPKSVKNYIDEQLSTWAIMGVHGHRNGNMPWAFCDEYVNNDSATIVGANPNEVVIMNSLTINLHLLLAAFYHPTSSRYRILVEYQAFPSDYYAFESHARLHGLQPNDVLLCLKPRQNEHCLRTEDILEIIKNQGNSIAIICFSGIQYYTGQLFDMEQITKLGQQYGCLVGWDLAHAVGNVPLYLHEWNVDFACWCTYKYLNSSAGGVAGIFVHEKHLENNNDTKSAHYLPSLQGWWGHRIETRFDMTNQMEFPLSNASAYRVSNPPILLCCALKASLDVFNEVHGGMETIRKKSILLTGYLEQLICYYFPQENDYLQIITPSNPQERGAQLSLKFISQPIDKIFDELQKRGIACDERKPNVIRFAPAPLYNSYRDVWRFVNVLKDILVK